MLPVLPFSFLAGQTYGPAHSKVAGLFEERAHAMCANDRFHATGAVCNWETNLIAIGNKILYPTGQ